MKKLILVLLLLAITTAATADTPNPHSLSGLNITVDNDKNLTVSSIETGSIAENAGIKPDDRIIGIDNSPVCPDPAYVMASIDGTMSSGRSVLLLVIRQGEKKTLWLKQTRLGIHQEKALVVYTDIKTKWYDIKEQWQDFLSYLDQVSLKNITSEKFQKLSLKNAECLQVLRSGLIDHDRKLLQSQPVFEKEIARSEELACYTVFTMDQIIQQAAYYSSNSQIDKYFDRLQRRKDEISKYISKVELHLFKAKQAADII